MSALGRFYRELERRRVIRVVSFYCVAAWIIIEAADVVLPALFMPDWILRLIIIAAFIGFPFAIAIAWVFDLTSAGVVRTPDVEAVPVNRRNPQGRWWDFAAIAILLALVVYLWQRPVETTAPTVGTAIAVLPFADLSPLGDSAYLGDGIAEELLNTLANVEGIRVAARTSSFAYRNSDKGVQDIGSELSVDTVLEGSVRKSGDQLRITAQLINVADGFHLWSSTFDRKLDDIFAIQDEIATAITDAMRVELLPNAPAAQWATNDITAYELYLKGRHELRDRTAESLDIALDFFQQAITQDDQFAPAYAGLAEAALLLREYGNYTLLQARAVAEPALERALAIDPQLADAYASRGLLLSATGRLSESEDALRKALALDPNNAQAHNWLGNLLMEQGKPAEALMAYQRVHEIEPLLIPGLINLAQRLHRFGRYQEARELYLTLLEIRSQYAGEYRHNLASVDHDAGALASSANWLAQQLEADPFDSKAIVNIAMLYAAVGDSGKAAQWLNAARQLDPESRTVLENYSVLMLQQGQFKQHRVLAEAEIERFGRDLAAAGSTLSPELYMWGGYAAYFDGDYAVAYERFMTLARSYAATGSTVVTDDNFEALCLLIHAANETGAPSNPELLASLRQFLQLRAEAGVIHHQLAYGQALLAATTNDLPSTLVHLSTAVNRGWRDLGYSIQAPIFAPVRNAPEMAEILARHNELLAREREQMPALALPAPPDTTPIRLSDAQRDEYVGTYRAGVTSIKIYDQGGELWTQSSAFPPRRLIALGPDQFLVDLSSRRLQMFRDAENRLTHYEERYEGKIMRAKRAPVTRVASTIELTADQLQPYVGVFTFPSLPYLSITISQAESRLLMAATGTPTVTIVPESRLSFYNEAYDGFIRFVEDSEGNFREIILQRAGNELRGYRTEVK